jgi:hypothetical protein
MEVATRFILEEEMCLLLEASTRDSNTPLDSSGDDLLDFQRREARR